MVQGAILTLSIKRSGAWVDVSSVKVRRSGVWVTPTSISVKSSGVWEQVYPSALVETLVDRTTGTIISNATTRQDNAFDGNTNQAAVASANKNSAGAFYIGKTFGAGKIFSKAVINGTNNTGYTIGGSNPRTVNIRGKNGTPTDATDGTLIGTISFNQNTNESSGRTITSIDTDNTYTSLFAEIADVGQSQSFIAELTFYELL